LYRNGLLGECPATEKRQKYLQIDQEQHFIMIENKRRFSKLYLFVSNPIPVVMVHRNRGEVICPNMLLRSVVVVQAQQQ
jgi:hypothetical protein